MNELVKDLKKIRQLISQNKLESDKVIDFALVYKIIDSFIDKYPV